VASRCGGRCAFVSTLASGQRGGSQFTRWPALALAALAVAFPRRAVATAPAWATPALPVADQPINLFLIGNLKFFLAPSLSDFTLVLDDQYRLQPYSVWIALWIDSALRSGIDFETLAAA